MSHMGESLTALRKRQLASKSYYIIYVDRSALAFFKNIPTLDT